MVKLTNDYLKTVMPKPGKRLEVRDDLESGLTLRVTSKGKRSWSYRYRGGSGEQHRVTLGPFPAVSLSRAREEARKIKGLIAQGTDLVAVKQAEQAEEKKKLLNILDNLAGAYFEDAAIGLHRPDGEAKRESTISSEKRIYERLIAPEFGKVPVSSLTRQVIQDFVTQQTRAKGTKDPEKTAPSNGRHCRDVIRQILSYAMMKGLVDHNAALSIAVSKSKPRKRFLVDAELRAFWNALENSAQVEKLSLSPEMALCLKMATVTLQRGGEVAGMRWSEVDFETRVWNIPADRMKGKRPQAVPLSKLALQLLDEAKALIGGEVFVFESRFSRSEEAAHLDRRSATRAMVRVIEAIGIPHATPHDLRRTGTTMITGERVGIPRFIASQALAHAGDTGGAAAVTGRHYDMNDYLPEKRRALDAWAVLLMAIVSGEPIPTNVTRCSEGKSQLEVVKPEACCCTARCASGPTAGF